MSTISIKPELFIWARKRAGFEVPELLSISQNWLNGSRAYLLQP